MSEYQLEHSGQELDEAIRRMLEGDSIDAGDPTTISGLLKGNGTAISAAAAGSDYATPEQLAGKQNYISARGILKGDGQGGILTASSESDYATPGYVNGQISVHNSASGAHINQFNAKLDKIGGVVTGGLTVLGGVVLTIDREAMLKTSSSGKISAATAGTDYEQVTFGGTTTRGYAKFAGGLLMCWGHQDFGKVAVTTPWEALYQGAECTLSNFMYSFTAIPSITVTPTVTDGTFLVCGMDGLTTSSPGRFIPLRPTPYAACRVVVNYLAVGRWK